MDDPVFTRFLMFGSAAVQENTGNHQNGNQPSRNKRPDGSGYFF
ncbi:hypothetical protein BMS3Abin05_01016 [bacterium BMS3Abin05]|nr:hypothetical protein BMS3Abin05_01016 [bacterium BMS3Abin05]